MFYKFQFNVILATEHVPVSSSCGYVIPLLKFTDKDPSNDGESLDLSCWEASIVY